MVDVGGGLGYLEGDEVGDGYGRDEEEEEEGLGGAKGHEKLERHAESFVPLSHALLLAPSNSYTLRSEFKGRAYV